MPGQHLPPITASEVREASRVLATAAIALQAFATAGEQDDMPAVVKAWQVAGPALGGVAELLGAGGLYGRLADALCSGLSRSLKQ